MTYIKLATDGIWKNKKYYFPYIIATSILFASNYILFSILQNQSIKNSMFGSQLQGLIKLTLCLLISISVIFMIYVDHILSKSETRELGLYNILGFTNQNLKVIITIRLIANYLISAVIGLILGINFNRFSFMTLQRMLNIKEFKYSSVTGAAQITLIMLFLILLLLLFIRFSQLKKVNPLDLWKAASNQETEIKAPVFSGILGIIILGSGYYLAVTTQPTMMAIVKFMMAVFLVVFGTYLVFSSFSILLLKLLQKNKHFYYQSRHLISVSGMLHRMKSNGISLASICLLCSAIVVVLIGSVSMEVGKEGIVKLWCPSDITLTTSRPLTPNQKEIITECSKTYHVQAHVAHQAEMTTPIWGNLKGSQFEQGNIQSAKYQLTFVSLSDYNRAQHTNVKLNRNEALFYCPDVKTKPTTLNIGGQRLNLRSIKTFNLFANYDHSIVQPAFVIVKDIDGFQKLTNEPLIYLTFLNTKGTTRENLRFASILQTKLELSNTEYTSKYLTETQLTPIFGSFLFLGVIISIILLIITTMMIYYKQIAEGLEDRQNFQTMQQIGLSQKETSQTIHSQILMVFGFPILGAIINACFAFPAIRSILKLFSIYNFKMVLAVSSSVIILMIAFYLLIYFLTTRIYRQIINQRTY